MESGQGCTDWEGSWRKMRAHTLAATVTLLWLPIRNLGPSGEKQERRRRQERGSAFPLHIILTLPVNLRSPALVERKGSKTLFYSQAPTVALESILDSKLVQEQERG